VDKNRYLENKYLKIHTPTGDQAVTDLKIVMAPRELYYHEVAYVRGLEAEIERLRAIAENVEALRRNLEDVSCRQQNEIERLKATYESRGGNVG
jgi:hypothetical protein